MQLKNKQDILTGYFKSLDKVFKLELQKDNDELLVEQLVKVGEHIKEIFSLNDKKHFESLMLSDSQSSYWNPEEYSKPFTEIMKFYKNIYIGAIDKQSKTLWLETSIDIGKILELLTPTKESQKEFINYHQFLEVYFSFHREIFEYALEQESPYRHSLGYHWYTSQVFNYWNKEKKFNLDFLLILDKQLWSYILFGIDKNDFEFFKYFIDWLHSGIGFYNNEYSGLYEFVGFGSFDETIDIKMISELDKRFNSLLSKEDLDKWLSDFEPIKMRILAHQANDEKAKEIDEKAINQYLFHNIKELTHGVGAYLVYKQKFDWIKYLWNFKQPEDSDTSWAGHSIIPESVSEWIIFLKNRSAFEHKFSFRDGHSESTYYYERYEVLLIGFILSKHPDKSFTLPKNNEIYLANLKFYIDKLEKTLNEMCQKEEGLKLFEMMIKTSAIFEDIADIFKKIQEECNKKIDSIIVNTKILEERVEKFKTNFFNSYQKNSGLKHIVKDFTKTYTSSSDTIKDTFGINTRLPKDIFVSKLIAGIDMMGSQFAREIVNGEDRRVLDMVIAKCHYMENEKEFSNVVKKIENLDDAFIITFGAFKFLMHSPDFEGAWKIQEDELKAFSSFEGRYIVNGKKIPVFRIFYGNERNRTLVLNKKKFIDIVQYIPADVQEDVQEDGFKISIELLSSEIKAKILEKNPHQKEELEKQIHLKIVESFDVHLNKNFEGYFIDL